MTTPSATEGEEEEYYDAIIIGAGAAGLTAGYDIHYYDYGDATKKYKYMILEASSDLGGRLRKLEKFVDFPIDIGGEWIHTNPTVLDDIYDADPSEQEQPTDLIKTIEYVDTYEEWDDEEWVEHDFPTKDYKFVNYTWYDFFKEWMSPDLNITYQCQVIKIDYSSATTENNNVEVTCKDRRRYKAKHVIVTVSIGILQQQQDDPQQQTMIQFTPALPTDVVNSIDTYWMMGGMKVFLRFKERFYKEAFEFASDYSSGDIGSRYYYNVAYGQEDYSDDHVLGCFSVGDLAEPFLTTTMSSDNEEIYNFILDQLDSVYDGKATPNFIEGFVQNWNNEPFVRGAYTYLTDDDDDLQAIHTMRQSVGGGDNNGGKIFFAGEAIPSNNYEYGFAHEAAFSGRAAAKKCMELLESNNNKDDSASASSPSSGVNRGESEFPGSSSGGGSSSGTTATIYSLQNQHWMLNISLLVLLLRKIL